MTLTAPDTEDEAAIRETARSIATRCRETESDGHTRCWEALRSAGFPELRSDDGGGPAATVTQTAVVVEELARVVCGAPLLGTLLAAELARLGGAPEALTDGAGGAATVLLAPGLETLGRPRDGVAVDAGDPVRCAVFPLDGELAVAGLGPARPTQDLSRPVAEVAGEPRRTGLRLPPGALDSFTACARTLLAADLLGAAAGVFEDAVAYSRQRVQFGVPIGSFQAVQHLLGRAYVRLEGVRSTMLYAAWALDSGAEDGDAAALVAKAHAGRAALDAVHAAIQVYGGVAITWEFPAHRHLRRVLLDSTVLGTPDALAGCLVDQLQGVPDGVR